MFQFPVVFQNIMLADLELAGIGGEVQSMPETVDGLTVCWCESQSRILCSTWELGTGGERVSRGAERVQRNEERIEG